MDDVLEFVVMKILFPVIIFGALALLIALPFACYADMKSDKILLRKDSWDCAETYTYTQTTMVMSGKIMVPMITQHTECKTYRKKGV